jgi:hypothetical protein
MAVRITLGAGKPIGNRRAGYERKVREIAPMLIALQNKGYISAAHLAEALREIGVRTDRDKPYAESTIFGMVRRGKQLGLPLLRRTRSEAASSWIRKPRPPRISPRSETPSQRGITS